jgi:hypothetical protein
MLKSKIYFFMNLVSLCLLVTSVTVMTKEAEHYTGQEKLWEQESWSFWKK